MQLRSDNMKAPANWLAALVLCCLIGLCIGAAYMLPQQETNAPSSPTTETADGLLPRVEIVQLGEGELNTEFTRRGVLQPSEQVTVYAETSGSVLQQHASVGDSVRKGSPILELDGRLLKIRLDEARARQKSAQVRLEEAESHLRDAEESDDDDVARDAKYRRDAARAALDLAETQLAEATDTYDSRIIRAPIDGTIAQVWVDAGELAAGSRQVAEIIVTNPMIAAVALTSDDVACLRGQVQCEARVAGNASGIPATIRRIAPVADPLTKRFAVELDVDNEEGRLRAGMPVSVVFRCTASESASLLPRRALTRRGNALVCFRVEEATEGDHRVHQIEPQLAPIPGKAGTLRVQSGLDQGDEVAITGLSELRDDMRVALEHRDARTD
jgi:RND family efflux transporter MFP subunit